MQVTQLLLAGWEVMNKAESDGCTPLYERAQEGHVDVHGSFWMVVRMRTRQFKLSVARRCALQRKRGKSKQRDYFWLAG